MQLISNNKFLSTFVFTSYLVVVQFTGDCEGLPKSILNNGHGYDGGDYEEEEITYPFQQYIQVRKSVTVEHHPAYYNEAEHETSASSSSIKHKKEKKRPKHKGHGHNLFASATSSSTKHTEGDNDEDDGHHEYGQEGKSHGQYEDAQSSSHTKPLLREEITDHTKHEVYEEKGYSDSAYDHEAHGESTRYNHDEPSASSLSKTYHQNNHPKDHNSYNPYASASSTDYHRNKKRNQLYSSLHLPDGTSTKVLEYAASNLYDRDAHEKGSIYAARDNIYCPEVIDFDLSSKKMAMGKGGNKPRGAKPRLKGLGSKIKCLKNKYFGEEPLSPGIFLDPSESRHSTIEIPTFDQFYSSVRNNVRSMSSFHH